jgi:hypothetical protein
MRERSRFKCRISQAGMVALLSVFASLASAAGWVSGRVNAVNPATQSIKIDGQTFTLAHAASSATASQIRSLKPGQAVRYEAEGKVIKRIEVVKLPPS